MMYMDVSHSRRKVFGEICSNLFMVNTKERLITQKYLNEHSGSTFSSNQSLYVAQRTFLIEGSVVQRKKTKKTLTH